MKKKTIFEYEYEIKRDGKKQTVQQSETSQSNAKKLILKHIKGIESIKFKRRFRYPHLEKGLRVK